MGCIEEAYRLRGIAERGPIGQRHSSLELYDLLGKCMLLSEKISTDEPAKEEIRRIVTQRTNGKNRRYVERGSDTYVLVCRFVFENLKSDSANRANASRYAHTLRQASELKITGQDLATHLAAHGGINALFLKRPLSAETVTTRILSLATPITVTKGAEFGLRLMRRPDNYYDVVWSDTP